MTDLPHWTGTTPDGSCTERVAARAFAIGH